MDANEKGKPHSPLPDPSLNGLFYEVRFTPQKGHGVYATQALAPGTHLLTEKPLMSIPNEQYVAAELSSIFATLDEHTQQTVMDLASAHGQDPANWPTHAKSSGKIRPNGNADGDGNTNFQPRIHPSVPIHERTRIQEQHAARIGKSKTLLSVIMTNAISTAPFPGGSAIFETTSRFNHSCVPNAVFAWHPDRQVETVYVIRPVEKGEELTVSYIYPHLTAEAREWELRHYGFKCECVACPGGGDAAFAEASRQRRWRLQELDDEKGRTKRGEEETLKSGLEEIALLREEGLFGVVLAESYLDIARICSNRGDHAMAVSAAEQSLLYFTNSLGREAERTTIAAKAVRAFRKDFAAQHGGMKSKRSMAWFD